MRFFRIARAVYSTPDAAFSGIGAARVSHRWSWADTRSRAVYCSDSLALACLETLVHLRPLPRTLPESVFYALDIPDGLIERVDVRALPANWDDAVPGSQARDFGSTFLREQRAVALLLPTAIVPVGSNVLVNCIHPQFALKWVEGPWRFRYDGRLA